MIHIYGWSEALQRQFEPFAARGLVPGRVMVGAGADEREDLVRVGDRDGAVAELLEELVGDRARGALGQTAP